MTSHVNDFRSATSRGRSGGNKRTICLWQFLRELLLNPHMHHNWIRWIDRNKGSASPNQHYLVTYDENYTHSFRFLPRDATLARYMPSSCVCLSVTSRCSTETTKRRITQTTPHDSPGLWFSDAEDLGKTQTGSPPTKAPNAGGVG